MVKYYRKYYNYKYSYPKGKYYSNHKVTNFIKNWGKYKLSSSWVYMYKLDADQQENSRYILADCDNADNVVDNQDRFAKALKYCSNWALLKSEWTFWKCTGVLFEITPSTSNNAVVADDLVQNIFDGCICMALTQDKYFPKQFSDIVESDKSIILDIKVPQRVYFPIRTSDYTMFPTGDNLPSLPYYFSSAFVNFNQIPNAKIFPKWIVKITFYITTKDKVDS